MISSASAMASWEARHVSQKKQRNKPCPCGSGEKFKNCCIGLSGDQIQAKRAQRDVVVDELLKTMHEERKAESEAANKELTKMIDSNLQAVDLNEVLLNIGAY